MRRSPSWWACFLPLAGALACGADAHDEPSGAAGASADGGESPSPPALPDAGGGVSAGGGGAAGAAGQAGSGGLAGAGGTFEGGTGGDPTDFADAGDGGPEPLICSGAGSRFVTAVVEHAFGAGQSLGQDRFPEVIYGPPRGGGCCLGSTDTVSLGNGGTIVVEFEGNAIVDGPGADFIVFENAFYASGDESSPFAELATVSVSADGVVWHAFSCDAVLAPFGTCAGWHPVFANADTNDIDPLDPAVAGGDAFDLAALGLEFVRYVRIEDRADLDGFNGVFDLDAVAILNPACP